MRDTNLTTRDHAPATVTGTVNEAATEEKNLLHYFKLSINGTDYHFNAPLDSISYHENPGSTIYFQNAAITRFGWLSFTSKDPLHAGTIELFDKEAGVYLLLYEQANNTYPVVINECDAGSEFMNGHYAATYTDAYDRPVYEIVCSFRVRRKKLSDLTDD